MSTRTQLDALMAQIQELWGHLDTLFDDLDATDGWNRKHGPAWTMVDVPYHLAYYNSDVVARGLILGPDLPWEEQELLTTPDAVDAWNTHKLAERPFYQTPTQTVSLWKTSCEAIYCRTFDMTDADLERPFWMPFVGGWLTARHGLEHCRNHDYSAFMQLRIHMGRTQPVPSPELTRAYLGSIISMFPQLYDRTAANGQPFTAVLAFTDPGVGAWTVRALDNIVTASDGEAANADLVMIQSAETFEKSIRWIQDPARALRSGKIQVSNVENMATFDRLFPIRSRGEMLIS
jgi:hypothetical protein